MSETVKEMIGDPDLAHVFDDNGDNGLPHGYTQEMYDAITDVTDVKVGQVLNTTIASESESEILLDAGAKDYVRVQKSKYEIGFFEGKKFGEDIDVLIVSKTETPYNIVGSVAAIQEAKVHDELSSIEFKGSVSVYVREITPAGYNLDINHEGVKLRAFMPHTLAGINKLHENARQEMLGTDIDVMIESFSRDKGTYIVSRRKYLKKLVPNAIKELRYNEVYEGHVTGTSPYGVFVEFNECLTGMVHKSNINPEFVDKIKDIEAGTEIVFYVKEIIKDRIILTQILTESLWDEIEAGQELTGTIKSIKAFGALIKLDDETVGLIPTSSLDNASQMEEGDEIDVEIITVDRLNRKIFLKQM